MTETTRELFGPVTEDLATVESELRRSIAGDPPEVARPMADLFEAGGKRLRPALVLLSAMCGRYDLARIMPAAMAVELVHAATLVHDDVIDRSATRRGRPTVAAALGDEPAIVVGDFYFAKAYENAAATGLSEVVDILARAVMAICAGEIRQQAARYRYSTSTSEYRERIEAKTATLVSACCESGALLGGLDGEKRDALRDYGLYMGMAFQITDDVLDYTGTQDTMGKPIGHDVIEGFATLPLIYARLGLEDNRRLSEDEARRVVDRVRTSDGPEHALREARTLAKHARDHLLAFPPSETIDTLASLTDYVVTRNL